MKPRWLSYCVFGFFLTGSALANETTAVREWTSSRGTKVTARAVDLTDRDLVTLETSDGREINLQLSRFSKEDREFLVTFFRAERPHLKKDVADNAGDGKAGTIMGPLKADDSTSYYVYVPKSYRKGTRSSVMIWTQADGGRRGTLAPLSNAADLTGMVIATPVEARNEKESTLANNLSHSNDVLRAVKMKFSINSDAVYFGGNDTGGAAALWNSMKIKSSGTFTISAYFTPRMTGINAGYHFMSGGATDYNRYLTAWAAAKFGDNGTHYLYPGARDWPNPDTITTGILWMYVQSLYEDIASRNDEAAAFEKRFLPWIKELAGASPGEALFLTEVLTGNCAIRDDFKNEIETLHANLLTIEEATDHLEGRKELAEFSRKHYSDYGNLYTPLKNHGPKKFERMADRMKEDFDKA